MQCFNSRTHAGCDIIRLSRRRGKTGFNSRTHAGCDFTHPRGVRLSYHVSIHAPTRGATRVSPIVYGWDLTVSIHAPTRGATNSISASLIDLSQFQFTHPRGVRPKHIPIIYNLLGFNSRTHAGCDTLNSFIQGDQASVSIHAPTRGATYKDDIKNHYKIVSIHAPTRGATETALPEGLP